MERNSRDMMNDLYSNGKPYNQEFLWDRVRGIDIDSTARKMCVPFEGKHILDLGSGDGCGSLHSYKGCKSIVCTDISEVAMSIARNKFEKKYPEAEFMQMDACNLIFLDNTFDIVVAKEVLEHVGNPEKMISEAFRVLKPNGIFLLTSPNRNSLHLIMNRALGYRDFKCCQDHTKELTYDETKEMLFNTGFYIDSAKGIHLMPYWGVPGLDGARHLTDNDEEVINLLRTLGGLVGPKYAFCYVIKSVKPDPSSDLIDERR